MDDLVLIGGFATVRIAGTSAHKKYKESFIDALGFIIETSMLKKMHHPNIVAIKEVDVVERTLILQRFDRSLHRFAIESAGAFFSVTRQLVSAVGHVHAQGFLHRDIKPANIFGRRLHSRRPHVVLGDFNSATKLIPGRTMTLNITTRPYAPPEVLLDWNQTSYSYERDAWSLGISLLEMSTGTPCLYEDNVYDDDVLLTRIRSRFGGLPFHSMEKMVPNSPQAFTCDIYATIPHPQAKRIVQSLTHVEPHMRSHPATVVELLFPRPSFTASPSGYVYEERPRASNELVETTRATLLTTLADACKEFGYGFTTLAHTLSLFDRVVETQSLSDATDITTCAWAALYIASLVTEHEPWSDADVRAKATISDGSFRYWTQRVFVCNGHCALPSVRWITATECQRAWLNHPRNCRSD